MKTTLTTLAIALSLGLSATAHAEKTGLNKVQLGQALFFDVNLSLNRTQSCSTCHSPSEGYSDHRTTPANGMVSMGDDGKSFGNRNAPTASYAQFSPNFHYDKKRKEYVGGQFLDGRAVDLAAQAGGPPLNPVEMNMPDKATVVARLKENGTYLAAFQELYGKDVWNNVDQAYSAMEQSIAAYEKTKDFAPFNSKYDKFLRGEYELTLLEDLGRTLFFSNNNVNCSTCHKLEHEDHPQEPFTNYLYRNIGVPKNPAMLKVSGADKNFIDHGLMDHLGKDHPETDGKFKVPTLRNIAVTGPYMHNGVFQDLRTTVLFYDKYNNKENTINPETGEPWGEPEVAATIQFDELKANKLTDRKIDALVAFMELLTDEEYEPLLAKMKAEKAAKAKQTQSQ